MKGIVRHLPLMTGGVFLLTALTAVGSAWIEGNHRFDLTLSFSAYAGLTRGMSVLYFAAAVIMLTLLGIYIKGTEMKLIKKAVYAVVMLNIFGTALFPYNNYSEAPTPLTINIHNNAAICLMLSSTLSFIITAITARNRKQRIISAASLVYAGIFIIMYFTLFRPLFETIFIWEIIFILLLMIGIHAEQYSDQA